MYITKPLQRQQGGGLLGFPVGQSQLMQFPAAQAPAQDLVSTQDPFVWGDGGARMSPEEIARRRALSDKMGQSDYSPVGHWTQGLGRVVDGLMAGIERKKLNKASEANTAYSRQVMEALMKGGQGDVASRAMMDPSLSPDVQGFAKLQWERANPKPVNNDTSADAMLYDQRLGAGKGNEYLASKLDPIVTIPTPFGPYVGRQSGLEAALAAFKGGGQPAAGSAPPPPATLPSDFQFEEGGPGATKPRAGFR